MPVEFPSPVEFISAINISPSNELSRLNRAEIGLAEIDLPFFRLCACASAFQDQFAIADYGRYVLPLVRQELAHREATGQRGSLQHDYPGASDTTVPLPERTSA